MSFSVTKGENSHNSMYTVWTQRYCFKMESIILIKKNCSVQLFMYSSHASKTRVIESKISTNLLPLRLLKGKDKITKHELSFTARNKMKEAH